MVNNKIQQFYILKFDSIRLKNSNYNISIDLETARKNNEVISLSDSELLRQYRSLFGINFSYSETRDLINKKIKLNKDKNNTKNRIEIKKLQTLIDEALFVENIIMIKFNNISHYKTLSKTPLIMNGKNFVRLLCGAGNARKSVVLFCEEKIANKLTEIFNAGRNLETKMVLGKFTSYQSLFSSQTKEVLKPRFCIVHDYEFEKEVPVDWVYEDENRKNQVVEKRVVTKFMPFDGQGILSPEMAKIWSENLSLRYIPSSFIVRSAYLKGQCVVFDFKLFSKECGVSKITDIWGKSHNVEDLDAIISTSQFKLWQSYSSMQEYLDNCNLRNFGWGVSKYTPQYEKNFFLSSYQYLQCLDLSDEDIRGLCEPTINQIKNISFDDPVSSIIYQMGDVKEENIKENFFNEIDDTILKTLLINKDSLKDNHIKNSLFKKLNKKIKDSYIGSLVINGNYQAAVSDPYAFCEFVFGFEVKGLLEENEYYCNYWNKKNIKTVIGLRSPLTFKSEVNLLNLKNNEILKKWYGNISSGVIYNVHGVDCMLHGGSD